MDHFMTTGVEQLSTDYFKTTESECAICQDAVSYDAGSDTRVVKIIACKHVYHHHCLQTWFTTLGPTKNGTCPFDRRVLYPAPRPAHMQYPSAAAMSRLIARQAGQAPSGNHTGPRARAVDPPFYLPAYTQVAPPSQSRGPPPWVPGYGPNWPPVGRIEPAGGPSLESRPGFTGRRSTQTPIPAPSAPPVPRGRPNIEAVGGPARRSAQDRNSVPPVPPVARARANIEPVEGPRRQSQPTFTGRRSAQYLNSALLTPPIPRAVAGSPHPPKSPTRREARAETSPSWMVTNNPAASPGRTLRSTTQREARLRNDQA